MHHRSFTRPLPVGPVYRIRPDLTHHTPIMDMRTGSAAVARWYQVIPGEKFQRSDGYFAVYWVNGTEQIVPAPPDDAQPSLMAATAVSGDGSRLLVEDTTGSNPSKVETYVYQTQPKLSLRLVI